MSSRIDQTRKWRNHVDLMFAQNSFSLKNLEGSSKPNSLRVGGRRCCRSCCCWFGFLAFLRLLLFVRTLVVAGRGGTYTISASSTFVAFLGVVFTCILFL